MELEVAHETPETGATPEGNRKKMIFMLIPIVSLLVVGGAIAGWFFFLRGGSDGQPQATAEAKPQETALEGMTVSLEPFIVNLFDPKGIRYLKIQLDVEMLGVPEEVFKKETPKIRDSLIILMTSKGYEEISSIQGKLKLREEILYRINKILGDGKAKAIYFTDFVVQ